MAHDGQKNHASGRQRLSVIKPPSGSRKALALPVLLQKQEIKVDNQ
jgi:hypothetical protein